VQALSAVAIGFLQQFEVSLSFSICSGVGQITSQRIGQALHINEATLLEMEGDEPLPLPATMDD
jgi:hypothetical protein